MSYVILYYFLGCCEENETKFINVDNLNDSRVEYEEGDSDESVSDDDEEENDNIEVYQLVANEKKEEHILEMPVCINTIL